MLFDKLFSDDDPDIAALADAEYDGDYDQAYEHVLQTGLEHAVVPSEPGVEAGDGTLATLQYIDGQTGESAALFPECVTLGTDPNCQTGKVEHASRPRETVLAAWETLSQYPEIQLHEPVFSIADAGGQWIGWGLGDFVTALARTSDRYADGDRSATDSETLRVLLTGGGSHIQYTATHDPDTGTIRDEELAFWSDRPGGIDNRVVATVTNHLDADLDDIVSKTKSRRRRYELRLHPVPVIDVIEDDPTADRAEKVLVDCAAVSGLQQRAEPPVALPEQAVMHLSDSVPLDRIDEYTFVVNVITGMILQGTWAIGLQGYATDDEENL